MKRRVSLSVLVVAVLLSRSVSAEPVTIYSTFGPGDTYGSGAIPMLGPGWPQVAGAVSPGQQVATAFFVPTGLTFALTSLELALSTFGDSREPVQVPLLLVRDESGRPGASILEQLHVMAVTPLAEGGSIRTVTSLAQPTLQSGTQYWIVGGPATPGQAAGWNTGMTFSPGALRRVGDEWTTFLLNAGALRVSGNLLSDGTAPVPEPGTMLLVGAGVVTIARSVRRRAHNVRPAR